MRKNVYIFFALYFFISANIFCQWVDRSNGLPNWGLAWAIDACNENTVVISFNSGSSTDRIFLTTNGGVNWKGITIPYVPIAHDAIDIAITDKNHIWAALEDGRIIATADGGTTWQVQFYDTNKTEFFNYIEMFDANKGIAMGDCNTVNYELDVNSPALFLKTTNGGADWIQTNTNQLLGVWTGDTWRRMDFVDAENGFFFVAGETPQRLYLTNSAGTVWNTTSFDRFTQILKFYDQQFGLAYNNKEFYKTANSGNSWETFLLGEAGWGNDIEFIPGDPAKVWFTDNRKLFFSADSGKTWHVSDSTIGGRDIVFTDVNNGWILCDNGKVYSTANGSNPIVGIDETNLNLPKDFILEQNYPNPFNPETVIGYSLPAAGHVSLVIYDVLGNEIAILAHEFQQAGVHNYRFTTNDYKLTSGIYFYKLTSGNHSAVKKMLLLK